MLPEFDYVRPGTVAEAVRELAKPGRAAHAGGTDLLGCLRDRVSEAATVVSLARLAELRGIAVESSGAMRIGALATLSEIAAHPAIRERYRALALGAAAAASPQLRNQGTLGGNLCQRPRCWYLRSGFHCLRQGGDTCYAVAGENEYHSIFGGSGCFIVHPSDTAPALMALGAIVHTAGPGGRRAIGIDRFFVLPERDPARETVLRRGEIVTHVTLPAMSSGLRSGYRKVRARGSWDFALAGVALAVRLQGRRVAASSVVLSGVAPIPWRAVAAERALAGAELTDEVCARAAEAAVEGAQPLAQNGYKVELVRGIVEEELLGLT